MAEPQKMGSDDQISSSLDVNVNPTQAAVDAASLNKSIFMLTHESHQHKNVLMMQSIKLAFSASEISSVELSTCDKRIRMKRITSSTDLQEDTARK